MTCPNDEVLARFCSGALADEEGTALLEHLEACEACSRVVALVSDSSQTAECTERQAEAPKALSLGQTLGDYVITEELGRGGMGIVYSAYDQELDREVALKTLVDRRPEEPLREARALAKLDHPNIVRVHKVLRHQGSRLIVMERVDGRPLCSRADGASHAALVGQLLEVASALQSAHDQGVVHADIKPSNVLVDAEGRAKIADFGLAMSRDEPERASGGTPKYMAPETRATGQVTAASDQYSVARTFAEALGGTLAGPGIGERPSEVAKPLWRALERASSEEVRERFPSMRAFAEAVRPKPAGKRLGVVVVVASLGMAAVAALVATRGSKNSFEASRCASGDAQMESIWNEERGEGLRRQFSLSSSASAPAIGERFIASVDRFAASWRREYRDACEATHVRGEQSDALLDVRMRCLRVRKTSLDALLGQFGTTEDASLQRRALEAFERLPEPEDCARTGLLSRRVSLPASQPVRLRIAELEETLATMEANLELAGPERIEALRALEPEVLKLAYAPLIAQYHYVLGRSHDANGSFSESEEAFDRAAKAAAEGRDDERLVATLNALMAAKGYRLGKVEGGKAWAEAAELLMQRADSPPGVRARFFHNKGMMLLSSGEFSESRDLLLKAAALLAEVYGPETRELVSTWDGVGTSYYREGNLDAAAEFHTKAIELGEVALGALHHRLASPLNNLALVEMKRERYEHAVEMFERALEILVESAGARSTQVGMVTVNLANAYSELGDRESAASELEKALPILEEALGPGHPMLAETVAAQARVASEQGHLPKAIELQRKAIGLREQLGETHPAVLTDRYNLAGLLCQEGASQAAQEEWAFLRTHTAKAPVSAGWPARILLSEALCRGVAPARCKALVRKAAKVAADDTQRAEAEAAHKECGDG